MVNTTVSRPEAALVQNLIKIIKFFRSKNKKNETRIETIFLARQPRLVQNTAKTGQGMDDKTEPIRCGLFRRL